MFHFIGPPLVSHRNRQFINLMKIPVRIFLQRVAAALRLLYKCNEKAAGRKKERKRDRNKKETKEASGVEEGAEEEATCARGRGELSTHSIESGAAGRLLPVMKLDTKRKFERERDATAGTHVGTLNGLRDAGGDAGG